MPATDQMLARLAAESEEKTKFVDGLIEAAEKDGRDLTSQELELVTRSRDRQKELTEQMEPLEETLRISNGSRERIAELSRFIGPEGQPPEFEYRSAGQYALDYWQASVGVREARERLETFNRAAAHQTTADNPGLLPTPIVSPVVNFIDASRPLVSFLGPKQIPSNTWVRPKVTQHTTVALQPGGEKQELVSQKMTIAKLTATAATYGGYVNVSRQDIDWAQPSIMDTVIGDLASVYAKTTETVACAAAIAAAPTSTTIPTGAATSAALTAALWKAAGEVFTATAGSGRVAFFISVDMLGLWAPLFAPVNPQNAQSEGFRAADFGTGLMGQISGIPVYVSAGLATGTDGRRLLGRVRGVRGQDRFPAGDRAQRPGYPGGLCGLLHVARDRDDGPAGNHQDTMSEPGQTEPIEEYDTSGLMDAPNQQVVRPDGSGPADEGEGGSTAEPEPATEAELEVLQQAAEAEVEADANLDEMTKDELLEYARQRGVSPANNDMTKAEIREAIEA